MTTIRRTLVAMTLVALAATLTTSCSSPARTASANLGATTSLPTQGQPSTAAASAPQESDHVDLAAYSNNDGPTATAVLTGAIGDYGKAISVHPDGSIDPERDSELELALSYGSLRLNIAGLASKLANELAPLFRTVRVC